jgi:hypothetical protein
MKSIPTVAVVALLFSLFPQSASHGLDFGGPDGYRLRGSMCGDRFEEQNFKDLRALGANLVRWHLSWDYYGPDAKLNYAPAEYDAWLQSAVVEARKAADACRRYGMLMILDLASPPGDRDEKNVSRIFTDEYFRKRFIEVWQILAQTFKDNETVYAFELINEPEVPDWRNTAPWTEIFVETVKAIRKIDPGRAVVFHVIPWDNSFAYLNLAPVPLDRVIYTLHMYDPQSVTYQLLQGPSEPYSYPGTAPLSYWAYEVLRQAENPPKPGGYSEYLEEKPARYFDKETLRLLLRPLREFEKKIRRPDIHRRIQLRPLGARRFVVQLHQGLHRALRGIRLGLVVSCVPVLGLLERRDVDADRGYTHPFRSNGPDTVVEGRLPKKQASLKRRSRANFLSLHAPVQLKAAEIRS